VWRGGAPHRRRFDRGRSVAVGGAGETAPEGEARCHEPTLDELRPLFRGRAMSPTPQATPAGGRVVVEAALVGLGVFAYLWLFRLYGFDIVDEGTLLAQIDRVARGGRPYVDFETGYTPGFFAVHAGVWHATGAGLAATRTFGITLHALTVALLYAFAVRAAGRTVGGLATLLQVAFLLPVSMRFGAHFNVPYPGWLVAPLALAAQAAVATRARGGRRLLAVIVAGVAAGVAFSIKPNAGLLTLAGAALGLSVGWRSDEPGARVLSALMRVAAPLGAVALLHAGLDTATFAALVVPVAVAAFRVAPAGAAESASPVPASSARAAVVAPKGALLAPDGAIVEALVLAATFLGVVLPWLLPLCFELGLDRVATEVFLLDGGGVVSAYLLPYPLPALSTFALVAGMAAAAAVTSSRLASFAPLLLLAGLAGAALFASDARLAAEDALLWLAPAVLVAGLLVARGPALASIAFAAIQQVQMFPRPDLVHLAQIGPSLLLAAAFAGRELADRWRAHPRDARAATLAARAVLGAFVLVALARLTPSLAARLGSPMVPLPGGERDGLVLSEGAAPDFAWLGRAVGETSRRTAPGDPVFTFPDLAGVAFLAGRTTPFFYLYYVPGRPDLAGERRAVADLDAVAPQIALLGTPRVPAFRGAEGYFKNVAAYLTAYYREVASEEGYRVLERRPVLREIPPGRP
jgi:hypothetical protein